MPVRAHYPLPLAERGRILALRALNLRRQYSRRDRADDAVSDLVLNTKYIFKRTIESFRPDVVAAGCVDDMGAAERSVRTYLKELETASLLEIEQRGLGKTNLYKLYLTIKPRAARRS